LKIVLNANGWGAYDKIDLKSLVKSLEGFGYEPLEVDGHSLKSLNSKTLLSGKSIKTE